MSKYTKKEYAEAKRQSKELLKLILQKTGTPLRSIHDFAEQEFVVANLDVVTPSEREKFPNLVFGIQ